MAKLGNQVAQHFAHQAKSQCAGETYLHQLAKRAFVEELRKCFRAGRPFQIEWPMRLVCNHHGTVSAQICQTLPKPRAFDLVPNLCGITVEKQADDFVPDIVIESLRGHPVIWVEMAVTHRCSPAKINSGKRIIEIRIQSEADVEALFSSHKLSSQDPRVKFINFPDRRPQDLCGWYRHCRLIKRVVSVTPKGQVEVDFIGKNEPVSNELKKRAVHYLEEFVHQGDQPNNSADYTRLVEQAILRHRAALTASGNEIRACGLCVHHDAETGCDKLNQQVSWEEALNCPDFKEPSEPGSEEFEP